VLRQSVPAALLIFFLICFSLFSASVRTVKATSVITVPDDFPTIQEAVNAASLGDIIYVHGPDYYEENVIVDKSVSLIGVFGPGLVSFNVVADNVYIKGFYFRSPWGFPYGRAIVLNGVSGCEISNVIVSNIDEGPGIVLTDASNNVISDSQVWGLPWGGGIEFERSSNNTIFGNSVEASYGPCIYLADSTDNKLFHNQFYVYEARQVEVIGTSRNVWDDGYSSGGNFWNDYDGTDLYHGPYQNETFSDGIGDSAYVIDVNNTDQYPLAKPYPWEPHDVGVTYIGRVRYPDVVVFRSFIWRGVTLRFDTFIMNYGNSSENLNVTAYANSTVIDQRINVTLEEHNSTILTLEWNSTGFPIGFYNITVHVEPVQGETEITDNARSVWMFVYTVGDLNGDGKVDIKDVSSVAKAFGQKVPPISPDLDINEDWKIDIRDISYVAKHFGEHYP